MTMTMEQPSTAFIEPDLRLPWPTRETMDDPRPAPMATIVCGEETEWLPAVVERLNELVALPQGWGGPATEPPTPDVAIACIEALNKFMPRVVAKPSILPTPEGGIQLEWHCGGWDLEVEFSPDGPAEYWGKDHIERQDINGPVELHEDLTLALKTLSGRQGG